MDIDFPQKLLESYRRACKPLCHELQIPQTAFDILLFLGNNPEHNTARDIVALRGIKANLVSLYVEQLVQEGYLERVASPEDRRKTLLFCTAKAQPIIASGQQMQREFFTRLFEGVSPAAKETFLQVLQTVRKNLTI